MPRRFQTFLGSNLECVTSLWGHVDVRASLKKQEGGTSQKRKKQSQCNCQTADYSPSGNVMLCSVILARLQVPATSFASTILCCFLSLLIWTVTVVGLPHVRSNSGNSHAEGGLTEGPPRNWIIPRVPPVDESKVKTGSLWQLESSLRMDLSTEDIYQASQVELSKKLSFCRGRFADIRRDLDYDFHKVYTCQRQQFQDHLVESMLRSASNQSIIPGYSEPACPLTAPRRNWIVFTAGVMGAGKSYTMKQLYEKGRFPLDAFVTVDPDSVRRHLPEFERYVARVPEKAGELTRKESGMISEMLTEAALRRGQNVLVDGTLRNSTWYQAYFQNLRDRYPRLQIGILHVTAPRRAVLERALSRAKVTGRVVPRDLLERTMVEVPKSIQILSQKVDFAVELANPSDASDVKIVTKGITWDSFQKKWKQSCVFDSREEAIYSPRAFQKSSEMQLVG